MLWHKINREWYNLQNNSNLDCARDYLIFFVPNTTFLRSVSNVISFQCCCIYHHFLGIFCLISQLDYTQDGPHYFIFFRDRVKQNISLIFLISDKLRNVPMISKYLFQQFIFFSGNIKALMDHKGWQIWEKRRNFNLKDKK